MYCCLICGIVVLLVYCVWLGGGGSGVWGEGGVSGGVWVVNVGNAGVRRSGYEVMQCT